MDIQEEREAFEAWFELRYDAHFMQFALDLDMYVDKHTQTCWETWQASKAQSDKKIKLLLCDEHLQKCESPTGIFNSQYPDEEPCLICLAKDSKAQAVPEGFVLMPRICTNKMAHAAKAIDGRLSAFKYADVYKAMIEAQEPAK